MPSARPARCAARCTAFPILIKDNVDVAGMVNSAGSLALADNHPAADAFMVKRLRDAGAVILGKTNLSEWANFRSTRSSSGWSSRGGQTKNPYVLDRNPCGSSSGTGTAIAASLARDRRRHRNRRQHHLPVVGERPCGIEADGRPRQPHRHHSDFGVAGHRGPDGAHGVGRRAAPDGDGRRRSRPIHPGRRPNGKIAADYTTFLKADALKGKRFGVVRQAMGYHPDVDASTTKAIDAIKAAGGEVIDVKVADLQRLERSRVRRVALRIQGRTERLPEEDRVTARVARSADRVEQGQRRSR